jgi:hypothetical protein
LISSSIMLRFLHLVIETAQVFLSYVVTYKNFRNC